MPEHVIDRSLALARLDVSQLENDYGAVLDRARERRCRVLDLEQDLRRPTIIARAWAWPHLPDEQLASASEAQFGTPPGWSLDMPLLC
jgi:hypothetical protein